MKTFVLISTVAIIVLSACGSDAGTVPDGAVIAAGDRAVFPEDITESFERYRGDTTSVDIFKENIIARELFICHAIDLGLDEDREVVRLTHERSRELLQAQYLSFSLDQVELDSGVVRDFWETMGTGISYTCFYHEDSLVADSVCTMVKNGEDLSRFAVEIGMDEIIRQTRGNITLDDRNFSNVMDYPYLITAVPGDVIGPFPVTLGWRLLHIDSTWTYEPEPFESDSQRIGAMLLARSRETRKKFLEDSLKTAYHVQVNYDALNIMQERSDSLGYSFGAFLPEEEEMEVVSWDGGSRNLFSVAENIQGLPGYLPRYTKNLQWLDDYARRLALFDIEMEEAIVLGLDTAPDIARQLNSRHWENLLDKYYEVIISPEVQPDSTTLNEIYLEVRDDHLVPESRVFNVLFLKNAERIQAAQEMMSSGGDVLAAKDEFETFPPVVAEGEETLSIPFRREMIPEGDRESLWALVPGEEAVVSLSDTTALWFRLETVLDEHVATFEDIKDLVNAEARQRAETGVIQALVDSLSEEYHLYVDQEFFESFYVPLEADSTSETESSMEVI
jgi:hypothetical protein